MTEHIEIDMLWHLPEAVSLREAACLIAGYDPSVVALCEDDVEITKKHPKFIPALRALKHATRHERLKADTKWVPEYDEDTGEMYTPCKKTSVIDINETMILITELKMWLSDRGCRSGFFFPSSKPDYLNESHENYSPKLAAAVSAWEAVSADESLVNGTTAKQALLKWLRRNADKFALTRDDGNPNELGIEEVAKVANWDSKGGAPKTPVRKSTTN